MLSLDTTTKTKKSHVFFDWHLRVIECLEKTGINPIGSRQVWEYVNREEKISRASVINFLTKLHDLDLIFGHRTSGKGGKRFHYTLHKDRQFFDEQVTRLLFEKIVEEYGDHVNLKEQLYYVGANLND